MDFPGFYAHPAGFVIITKCLQPIKVGVMK